MNFDESVAEIKRRHAANMSRWKPKILSFFSGAWMVYKFFKDHGEISVPLLGIVALTFVLGDSAASDSGVKLFVRRAQALFIDIFLICVVLFVFVSWYQTITQQDQPQDILQIQL